jgi:hypothetical protein
VAPFHAEEPGTKTSTSATSATTVLARIIPRRLSTATRSGKNHPLGV